MYHHYSICENFSSLYVYFDREYSNLIVFNKENKSKKKKKKKMIFPLISQNVKALVIKIIKLKLNL